MVSSALFSHECGTEKNAQFLELLEFDFAFPRPGGAHTAPGFWQGCCMAMAELAGGDGAGLGCARAALLEPLGAAGMHQLPLGWLGCSRSPGIQLLLCAPASVRCANLSSQHWNATLNSWFSFYKSYKWWVDLKRSLCICSKRKKSNDNLEPVYSLQVFFLGDFLV